VARRSVYAPIAKIAGVSVATVSRVITGTGTVRPELRQRVLDAARELKVDLAQLNNASAIAFLLTNRQVLHPFHSRILAGATNHCWEMGWDLIHLPFRYPLNVSWKKLHLPRVIQRRDLVRAAIVAGANSQSLLDLLRYKEIPFVVLGNNVIGEWHSEKCDAVYVDNVQGGHEMTRYLQSLGHRDIWFVGNCRLPWFAALYRGYCAAMEEAALPPRLSEFNTDNERELGYLAAKPILTRNEPVTAIFAGSDRAAQGVFKALHDGRYTVPHHVSVAGFNDTIGAFLHPSLTTVRVFPEQVGRRMVELVLNRIANPQTPPQHVTIPTELVKRESCTAPLATPDAGENEAARKELALNTAVDSTP
jgi:LacI family transcriptional regulator, galactose operon repressor